MSRLEDAVPLYTVARLGPGDPAEAAGIFSIRYFYREGTYRPLTQGRLVLREGVGMELTMWCFEQEPRAIYHNPNDPVHTDSCMEGFLQFYPELPEKGYLSIEMNANGASHCSFGTGRYTRGFVVDRGLPHPQVKIERFQRDGRAAWSATALLRLPLLEQLYGRSDFPPGHRMRANFYKCGDHTEYPHWGSWAKITQEKLDFHSPACFGQLVIP